MYGMWQFNYWSTFFLSWLICQMMMEFWASGEFTWKRRMFDALKMNGKFYFIAASFLSVIVVSFSLYIYIYIDINCSDQYQDACCPQQRI